MKEAEKRNAEQIAAKRHGRTGLKWLVLPLAVLAVGVVAAGVSRFRQQEVREQLTALALEGKPGWGYKEGVRGPRWYVKLAGKLKLPVPMRPVAFRSQIVTDEDMAIVGRANTLSRVALTDSPISDACMTHFPGPLLSAFRHSSSGSKLNLSGLPSCHKNPFTLDRLIKQCSF